MDEFPDDFGSDADALASIGWGTDEDYGYYGEQYSIAHRSPVHKQDKPPFEVEMSELYCDQHHTIWT